MWRLFVQLPTRLDLCIICVWAHIWLDLKHAKAKDPHIDTEILVVKTSFENYAFRLSQCAATILDLDIWSTHVHTS